MSGEITYLKVEDIFNSEKGKYKIPIYQRNYAWKEPQIRQLIQDIYDYYLKDNRENENEIKKYYIGTLVVRPDKEKNTFEVIDGQQRLTTLSMLVAYLKNEEKEENNYYKNLENTITFQCRKVSTDALNKIWESSDVKDVADSISNAYHQILRKSFEDIVKEKEKFKKYLLENVIIYRISVPQDTDLNHYFEIMNTRGEQLEKHEILKAKLLSVFKYNTGTIEFYSRIWDACSDMGKYLCPKTLKTNNQENKTGNFTIENVIENTDDKSGNNNGQNNSQEDNIAEDRYRSIIDFPNFLLLVLKLMDDRTVLDDKKLLDEFDKKLKLKTHLFVEKFFKKLLTSRLLFDNYVIKRELSSGKWILKSLDKNGESLENTFNDQNSNHQILMLLSMFEVSFPNYSYKYWLFDVLKYLTEQPRSIDLWCDIYCNNSSCFSQWYNVEADDYIKFLEESARKKRDTYIKNTDNVELDYDKFNTFDIGTAVPNFIFNLLDYKLWRNEKYNKLWKNEKDKDKYKDFEFTYRDSVEHFYPQNPISGEGVTNVNSFGNLCLITSDMNSRLNNLSPAAKRDIWNASKSQPSIKLSKMMEMMETKEWNENAIRSHKREMLEILFDDRNPQNLKNRYSRQYSLRRDKFCRAFL